MQQNTHFIFLVWYPSNAISGMIHEYSFDTFVFFFFTYIVFSLKMTVKL